jgi:hypothetical protein
MGINMEIWIIIGILVVVGIVALVLTSRNNNKSTIKYTDPPVEVSQSEQIYNSNNDITKLGSLRSQGAITEEEYARMVAALSTNRPQTPVIPIPQKKGLPGSMYILPVFFGIIGGIIGALIAAKAYKTKWWPMLVVGLASSIVSWLIYALVIPVN